MRTLLFVIFLHLSGLYLLCGNRQLVFGDPALTPTVTQILKEATELGYKIPRFYSLEIQFENVKALQLDPDSVRIGFTEYYNTPFPVIHINRSSWNRFNATQRYMLVLHEIGHGIWTREHDETLLPDYSPKSIMFPSIFNPSIFEQNKLYYLQELFSNCCTI